MHLILWSCLHACRTLRLTHELQCLRPVCHQHDLIALCLSELTSMEHPTEYFDSFVLVSLRGTEEEDEAIALVVWQEGGEQGGV